MKKRKPPYLLVGILAVAMGAVVFMNATAARPPADLHQEDLKPTPIATDSKASVLENLKNAAPKDGSSMRPLIKPVKLPEGDAKLSRPIYKPEKPTPQKSDMTSQWYDEASGAGK